MVLKRNVWIMRKERKAYQNAKVRGLRAYYAKDLTEEVVCDIKGFLVFLKKRYYFPVRCNIYFKNAKNLTEGTRSKGLFYVPDEERKYPRIEVSCDVFKFWNEDDIYYSLVRLLTYYYQWYFASEDERSNRSLEIEATKQAKLLVDEYLNEKLS